MYEFCERLALIKRYYSKFYRVKIVFTCLLKNILYILYKETAWDEELVLHMMNSLDLMVYCSALYYNILVVS
jgi:hypothetical protein